MLKRILVALVIVSSSLGAAGQSSAASCPLEIDSVRQSMSVVGLNTIVKPVTETRGKVSFRYKNVSGRDIQSITLRISGRMQVSGPAGPSFLDKQQTVTVSGPMPANTSKKKSFQLPEGAWNGLQVELEQVRFDGGETWTNDGNVECVVNRMRRYRN